MNIRSLLHLDDRPEQPDEIEEWITGLSKPSPAPEADTTDTSSPTADTAHSEDATQ